MFGLRNRRPAVSSSRHARPFLEALEDRLSPADLTMNFAYGQGRQVTISGQLTGAPSNAGQTVSLTGEVSGKTTTDANGNYMISLTANGLGAVNAAAISPLTQQVEAQTSGTLVDNGPVISNFLATEQGNLVVFTGKVTDNWNPQGWIVSLGGDSSLNGVTATVRSDGTFSVAVEYLTHNETFMATAVTTDVWSNTSNTADTLVNIT